MAKGPAEPATLTLRKAEVQAVAEVLEQDYETVEDAAKAALRAAYGSFQRRDWYVITSREFGLSYGVYGSENEAVKKAEKGHDLGLGGELFVTRVYSAAAQEEHVVELDHGAEEIDPLCICGHIKSAHDVPGGKAGCYSPRRQCGCRRFQSQD